MNEIQIVDQRDLFGKEFTIYGTIDSPLFLASDVASTIGHTNVTVMIKNVEADEIIKFTPNFNLGVLKANQEYNFLTEDGLYEVLMLSRKPIARLFKKEVKNILKQIRKTGGYIPVQETDDDLTILSRAILIADKTMKEKDAIIAKQTEALSIAEPKAEFYDKLMNSDGYASFNVVAKELGVGRNKLMAKLREKRVLFNDGNSVIAYQPYVDNGYFIVKHCLTPYGIHCATTKVTPRGMEFLHRFVKKNMQEVAR